MEKATLKTAVVVFQLSRHNELKVIHCFNIFLDVLNSLGLYGKKK